MKSDMVCNITRK